MTDAQTVLASFELFGKAFEIKPWDLLGFTGNALFTARVLVQWVASEVRKQSVVPVAFWWLSLSAALVMIVFAYGCKEIPFILGLAVTLVPYIRNLMIHYRPGREPLPLGPILAVAVALGSVPVMIFWREEALGSSWFFFGLFGTAVYYSRFPVQWVASERRRESVMPMSFWVLSLCGSFLLLVYSVARGNIPFLIGFIFNGIPYVRNMMLIQRRKRTEALVEEAG